MIQALNSKFIIDGVPRELTPAGILSSVMDRVPECTEPGVTIVDETFDPAPMGFTPDPSKTDEYLQAVLNAGRWTPVPFSAPCTRARIATALIDSLWRSGKFRLDDLDLTAKWSFEPEKVGDMAAFYASVEAAADYLGYLRLNLRRFGLEEGPFDVRFATAVSGAPRLVDECLHPDPQSWVVYVPFDTSEYRFGGSQLAYALGLSGGTAPRVDDPDYLMDCFEIVREFAEDGVLLSAATVSSGGLLTALKGMTADGVGLSADISGIMRSVGQSDPVRVLFAEVPGAILQLRDSDFDYADAEFLLQDVAWFPLGHPGEDGLVHLDFSAKTGIQTILESLMQNAEGED